MIAQGPNPAVQQKVEAFKQASAKNKQALMQYSWIETTQLSLKGDVKSTKVQQCRYGPDGQVQKTTISQPPPPEKKRGVRGRVVEKKVDEMKDYMEKAVALIKQYVPPSPDKCKAAVAAGNASITPSGSGTVQLMFKNYVQPGDSLTLSLDPNSNMVQGVNVNSYLGEEKDAVTLAVTYQPLPDGTNTIASKVLNVAAKQIVVNITDNNYQKAF
ncbi:MAG: hypothetical protein U0V70_03705 [Terriglobia bacterium]